MVDLAVRDKNRLEFKNNSLVKMAEIYRSTLRLVTYHGTVKKCD